MYLCNFYFNFTNLKLYIEILSNLIIFVSELYCDETETKLTTFKWKIFQKII